MIELILFNAVIRTMDAARTVAEAVAISGNKIVSVGSTSEIEKLCEGGTRKIDAEGRLVLPGFNDAHVHFLAGGFGLSSVQLRNARSRREFSGTIRHFASKLPPGRWMVGGGWNHELWDGGKLPTKEWIDEWTRETPVLVERLDCHMALANSLALRLAGVTRDTPDPTGGVIVRDPKTGEPTGILKEAAMGLVERARPAPSFEDKLTAGAAASEHAASLGVTSVQDMSADRDWEVYQSLLESGRLKTRIYGMWPLPEWEALAAIGIRGKQGTPMLRRGGLKGFSDGSLGSTTALFFEPYSDAPGFYGLPAPEMVREGVMLERVLGADRAGLHLLIHAIGDKANDQILTMFEQASATNPKRERRHRIEHAQHLRSKDIPRFAQAGVIASVQPYHCADDGCWAGRRIGSERCKTTYAFRSLLDAGAALAFGSDWPVAPLDPILGVAAAVTRRTLDGQHPEGWYPEQKISVQEAVRAYIVGAAHAEFEDNNKGAIASGMLADLVMLDRDIFMCESGEIEKAQVLLTVMDGRVVHEAKSLR